MLHLAGQPCLRSVEEGEEEAEEVDLELVPAEEIPKAKR
jgi:hypothetical protein